MSTAETSTMSSSPGFLSPKDLADAIGVSESSLKRWVDDGRLEAVRTVGGHRRIALHEAVRFVRANRCALVRPDLLGFADLPKGEAPRPVDPSTEDAFQDALLRDDAIAARSMVLSTYLAGASIATIGDGPIHRALERIGELWKHTEQGILQEHRATDICIQAVSMLRNLLPPTRADAPVALGCGPSGDPYLLPSMLSACVVHEAGMRDVNLGPDTPARVLLGALDRYQPKLVWIAFSSAAQDAPVWDDVAEISARITQRQGFLIVGGRGVDTSRIPVQDNVVHAGSMAEMRAFAKGLMVAWEQAHPASHPGNGAS